MAERRSAAGAFLAIWHDVDPDIVDEYRRWHTFEHLPERLALPGFLRAHRMEREDGPGQDLLCVVEVSAFSDLGGSAYLARLDDPTPWTRRLMPHYRRVARTLCRSLLDEGTGIAPFACCVRVRSAHGPTGPDWLGPVRGAAAVLAQRHGVARVLVGRVDAADSLRETEEKRLRAGEDTGGYDGILVAGALDRRGAENAGRAFAAAVAAGGAQCDSTVYRHSYAAAAGTSADAAPSTEAAPSADAVGPGQATAPGAP